MKTFVAHLVMPKSHKASIHHVEVGFYAKDQDDAENLAASLAAFAFPGIHIVSVHEMDP